MWRNVRVPHVWDLQAFISKEYGQCRTAVLCAEAEFAIHEIGRIHLKNKSSSSTMPSFSLYGDVLNCTPAAAVQPSGNTPTLWPTCVFFTVALTMLPHISAMWVTPVKVT